MKRYIIFLIIFMFTMTSQAQNLISVREFLKINDMPSGQAKATLVGKGYKFSFREEGTLYYCRNCKPDIMENASSIDYVSGTSRTKGASIAQISSSGVTIAAFGKTSSNIWKRQLKELGWKFNESDSGQGAKGQDWYYDKGSRTIIIWNDYGDYYCLSYKVQ